MSTTGIAILALSIVVLLIVVGVGYAGTSSTLDDAESSITTQVPTTSETTTQAATYTTQAAATTRAPTTTQAPTKSTTQGPKTTTTAPIVCESGITGFASAQAGETRRKSCATGFKGSIEGTCGADGKFTIQDGCSQIKCQTSIGTSINAGTNVVRACNDEAMYGHVTESCDAAGVLTTDSKCNKVVCTGSAANNITVGAQGGDVVESSCLNPLWESGKRTWKCKNTDYLIADGNKPEFKLETDTCTSTGCPSVFDSSGGSRGIESGPFETVRTVSCSNYYRTNALSGNVRHTCKRSPNGAGSWDFDDSGCKRVCFATNDFTTATEGEKRTKLCQTGYSGLISGTCLADGSFSKTDTCARISCTGATGATILSGDSLTRSCGDDRYTGHVTEKCSLDGTLTAEDTCKRVVCAGSEGTGVTTGAEGGEVVESTCPNPWETGSRTWRCQNRDHVTPDVNDPFFASVTNTCKAEGCPRVYDNSGGSRGIEWGPYGTVRTVPCSAYYRTDALGGNVTHTCNQTGSWDFSDSGCKRICNAADGYDQALEGERRTRACAGNYTGTETATCQADGTFQSLGGCTEIKCSYGGNTYSVGTKVQKQACPQGQSGWGITGECRSGGVWSDSPLICTDDPPFLLRHKNSQKCVHPLGGSVVTGAYPVLWDGCTGEARLKMSLGPDNNIRSAANTAM